MRASSNAPKASRARNRRHESPSIDYATVIFPRAVRTRQKRAFSVLRNAAADTESSMMNFHGRSTRRPVALSLPHFSFLSTGNYRYFRGGDCATGSGKTSGFSGTLRPGCTMPRTVTRCLPNVFLYACFAKYRPAVSNKRKTRPCDIPRAPFLRGRFARCLLSSG